MVAAMEELETVPFPLTLLQLVVTESCWDKIVIFNNDTLLLLALLGFCLVCAAILFVVIMIIIFPLIWIVVTIIRKMRRYNSNFS